MTQLNEIYYLKLLDFVHDNAPKFCVLQGIVSILQTDNLHKEIPQVYRDTLELDIQGAMSSRKFTVARDLLLQVQTLNVVRRAVTGTLTCGDYIYKLRQGDSKAVDLLISVSIIGRFSVYYCKNCYISYNTT
jgi:hypothetical protein